VRLLTLIIAEVVVDMALDVCSVDGVEVHQGGGGTGGDVREARWIS
jgi:hypothetical protein